MEVLSEIFVTLLILYWDFSIYFLREKWGTLQYRNEDGESSIRDLASITANLFLEKGIRVEVNQEPRKEPYLKSEIKKYSLI